MKRAAIYVKDPVANNGSVISKEEQETACHDYCLAKSLTVSTTFRDTSGSRDQFSTMIHLATSPEAPFDAIVVWQLSRFSLSLEETIKYRDKLRRAGTRLLSATEKGIDD